MPYQYGLYLSTTATVIIGCKPLLTSSSLSWIDIYGSGSVVIVVSSTLLADHKTIGCIIPHIYFTSRAAAVSGGHIECQYELMSYGIPITNVNLDHDGNLDTENILRRIEDRRIKEFAMKELAAASNVVEVATDNDVLLGRGKPYQVHPGNLKLAKLIEERHEQFNNASKAEKTVITWQIVTEVREKHGGRFLERDESTGAWKERDNEVARIKVAYGFRSHLKMQRKRGRDTGSSSSPDDEKRIKVPCNELQQDDS